jgi:hypothetical protein
VAAAAGPAAGELRDAVLAVVNVHLEKAGIRLAALLNGMLP